jgi:hypothetical protein
MFQKTYGYSTTIWHIPTEDSLIALSDYVTEWRKPFDNKENLFIVYYAGHGYINEDRQSMWCCCADLNYASLDWSGIRTILEAAKSDVLFLLDCCAAASSISRARMNKSTGIKGTTETIAACGFETWAPRPGFHSFTNTLIQVLEDWAIHDKADRRYWRQTFRGTR